MSHRRHNVRPVLGDSPRSALSQPPPFSSVVPNIASVRLREQSHVVLSGPDDWADALADTDGPQLVLAGPGTGKTEFLARRVAHLIENGTPAASILVLTFSRRAAAELEARISRLLPGPVADATAATFHSVAFRLLEMHHHAESTDIPVLLTGPEQVRLVARLLATEDPSRWPSTFRTLLGTTTFADEVADFVMRCHERLIDPSMLAEMAADRADWRALPAFLTRYHRELEAIGRIDYGTLLSRAVALAARGGPLEQYSHVIVDEYQDTSPVQALLAEHAAGDDANLTVAADPHQSIYSFRGADLENVSRLIPAMRARDREVKTVVLGRSLRVPREILDSARRLVDPNPPGPLARIEVEAAGHTGEVQAYVFDQRSAEAEWIAAEIERLRVGENMPLTAMAVVVRSTRHLLPELSRALDRRHIPHDRPNTRLVDHPAIRIVSDLVQAGVAPPNTPDADLAVRRLLLGPLVGLSLGRERDLTRRGRSGSVPWPDLIRSELPEAAVLADLISDPRWATEFPAVDGFWHVWDRMPGLEKLVHDPDRADYRAAWASFARSLERQAERDPSVSLLDFLDAAATGDFEASPLLSFSRTEEEHLVVTTLHQAKGLEFDVVFIADAVEGVFPDTARSRSILQPQMLSPRFGGDGLRQTRLRLEEERRLAYTATTRARRRVVWTATTAGMDEGERRPSRFMLAATGLASFEELGPPPGDESTEFAPLTLSDAESRLRRLLVDPAAGPAARLAALATLATSEYWDPLSFAGVAEPGPDTGLVDGDIRLSPSQATLYDQCPRRYAFERRLHALDVDSPYMIFGSIVHEVLERAEKEALAAGLSHGELDTALRQLEATWEQYPAFGPPPIDRAWRRRAETLLEEMYGEWPGGGDPPVALEIELEATVDDVAWVGRADRIDRTEGGIKVVDYKTSKNPPPLKDVARSLQLGYYVLAASEHPQLAGLGPPRGAELWFPLAKGKRKVFPFDMANLQEVRESLATVAAGITGEDWTPRVGRHCERCPFRPVCPAWPDGREAYR